MTAYGKYRNGSEPTAYEEEIHRQVEEKKQKRAKQLAEVRAGRRANYQNHKRKYPSQVAE